MKGLIIQCSECGFSKMLNLNGTVEQIEEQTHQTISAEGWRYAYNRKNFICPSCIKGETNDGFCDLCFGKAKCYNKTKSYEKLLFRVAEQLENFKALDSGNYAKVESEV